MSLTELKTAVMQLPHDQLAELLNWLDEFQECQWERQIEEDFKSGKLSRLIQQAEGAFSEGKCREI